MNGLYEISNLGRVKSLPKTINCWNGFSTITYIIPEKILAQRKRGVVTPDMRIRKLTPRECWRLMKFSDEDFDKAQRVPTSDTQLYRQARELNLCKCTRSGVQELI